MHRIPAIKTAQPHLPIFRRFGVVVVMGKVFALGACLLLCTGAAQPTRKFALIIGANDGGSQQDKLRFAESDASKIAAVLTELGAVPESNVKLLLQPRATDVAQALDQLEFALTPEQRVGPGAVFFFYYSGHATANALNLGGDELRLDDLRQRLERLQAQVSVVMLDACQSGAFARTKGASRVADFSYNSVDRLGVQGAAVLASSSASELSQEADDAQGSYFTHHVVTAMRGAADTDDDGRVTLDEVYRYTYARTLEDTAKTRVGSQHVTFETTLRGQGGLPLTYLDTKRRRVQLPAKLSGRVLLFRASTGAVMADVRKVVGESFGVSLPAGTYRATVRTAEHAYQCPLQISDTADTTIDIATCTIIPEPETEAKRSPRPRTRLGLELGLGLGEMHDDAFDERLRQFSYGPQQRATLRFHMQGAFLWNALPFLAVFIEGMTLEVASYDRTVALDSTFAAQGYRWSSFGLGAGLRATLWLLRDWVNPYAQLSVGPAFALTSFDDGVNPTVRQTVAGWYLHPALGCNFLFHPRFGLYLQGDWYYAPILRNLMDEGHDSGGFSGTFGVRVGI